ncbi:MAG: DUF928 domain-containing protein [Actinomycetota bacterium]
MKYQHIASPLSFLALLASSMWLSAQAVTFTPSSNQGAPSQATGGASRGNFFTPPPGNSAPSQATGGASRSNFFTPASDKGAPSQATGGASRSNFFTPASGKGAPSQATGGASRGQVFTPPPEQGTPQQAAGGASRIATYYLNPSSVSSQGPAALIALLPQSFYGTTLSERPTIMVYLPASNAEEAVFSLKDEAGKMQYQMTMSVAGKSGVLAVQLPAEAPTLAVGKNYHWFLALKVDGQLSPSTPYVDGWIQRIQPSAELATVMQQQDALQKVVALGKNGVWYDCAATLAMLYSSQSTNTVLTQHWEELLSSVGLKEIGQVPLVAPAH